MIPLTLLSFTLHCAHRHLCAHKDMREAAERLGIHKCPSNSAEDSCLQQNNGLPLSALCSQPHCTHRHSCAHEDMREAAERLGIELVSPWDPQADAEAQQKVKDVWNDYLARHPEYSAQVSSVAKDLDVV